MDLKSWLNPTSADNTADILVLGFQKVAIEGAKLMKQSIDGQMPASKVQGEMVLANLNKIAGQHFYEILGQHTLVGGMHILLIAKKSIAMRVTDIASAQMSKNGAYYAVSIRFKIADTSFCFINCFLDGGTGFVQAQNRVHYLKEIYDELFKQERGAALSACPDVASHDVKVIMGDLNYRLGLSEDHDFTKVALHI